MSTFNRFKRGSAIAALTIASLANAAPIAFVPPNDSSGTVFSTNFNDGYASGRGIGFTVTSTQSLSSVGLYADLTNIGLTYGVYTIDSLTGTFNKLTTLASGGSAVTTSGLQFIDYAFAPITLNPGTDYLIEFSFNGNGNQNFFYSNDNVAWTQGAFTQLDGEQESDFTNSVVSAIRINGAATAAVPEPETISLVAIALAGFAALSWRSGRRTSRWLK